MNTKQNTFREYTDLVPNRSGRLTDKIDQLHNKMEKYETTRRANKKIFERKRKNHDNKVEEKIRKQKSIDRSVLISKFGSGKKKRIRSAWNNKSEVKPSLNRSKFEHSISQKSQGASFYDPDEINDSNVYKNLGPKHSRPITAKSSHKREYSRKTKIKMSSKMTPFFDTYHTATSKEISPPRSTSRERPHFSSAQKDPKSKLILMKELCVKQHQRHLSHPISVSGSKRKARPQSVGPSKLRACKFQLDQAPPEKVEISIGNKHPTIEENELVELFEAR